MIYHHVKQYLLHAYPLNLFYKAIMVIVIIMSIDIILVNAFQSLFTLFSCLLSNSQLLNCSIAQMLNLSTLANCFYANTKDFDMKFVKN
jgi:hypothetical protein